METWSAHLLFQEASRQLEAEKAFLVQQYATRLRAQGLPVIFSLGHLGHISGIDYDFLHKSVNRKRELQNYNLFSIKKRSGERRFIHAVNGKLHEVISLIRKHGFVENDEKIRIGGPGSRKRILGLLVDRDKPRISKDFYKRLDRLFYSIEQFGIKAVAEFDKFESVFGFFNHLSGLMSYLHDVDIENGNILIRNFKMQNTDFLKYSRMTTRMALNFLNNLAGHCF